MAIAALMVVPSTPQEWALWSFAHMAHHRDVNAAIYRLTGKNFELLNIDPIPLDAPGAWIELHQEQHDAQDRLLNIEQFNLNGFDPKDRAGLESFILQNYALHYAEGLKTNAW